MSDAADVGKLVEFVRSAKSHGAGDRFLLALLRQQGWPERRIYAAFCAYYEETTGLPVPARGNRTEYARDAFFYLLAFVTLAIWTVALVWLSYVLIDRAFPSPLDPSEHAGAAFRASAAGPLASLVVAFPIFIAVSRAIVGQTHRRPESLDSGVRKWLTYAALVATSLILLGDGVWFLQQFLLGDLTRRFVLKAAMLFGVAGAVLWYYLGAMRAAVAPPSRDTAFASAATAAVVVAVALGFAGIGTPAWERSVRLDQQRVHDLQTIARVINDAYEKNKRLPDAIPPRAGAALDPATHLRYGYATVGASHYQLCATFGAANPADTVSAFWKHPTGRTCYALDTSRVPD